ncbi:uncharacterized protein LOC135473890 isoform X2 [Liolophura sinensis]
MFGAHRDVVCPTDGSISAAEAHCCVPRCGDCVVENERDSENVFNCNNKRECSIWTRSSYVDGCFPLTVTTYMVVLYKCNNTNQTIPDTSVTSTTPSFNQVYCSHNEGDPGGKGQVTPSIEPTTLTPTPPIAGPRQAVGCYSSFYKQKIEIKCQRGEGIAIYGVFFATKSNSSCPSSGFISTPEQTGCCVPACGDCVISQSNDASYIYQNCSGERECSPWTQLTHIEGCGNQEYTSYMVVHYECLRDFSHSLTSEANGMLFEEIYGCPLPSTTPPPATTLPPLSSPTKEAPTAVNTISPTVKSTIQKDRIRVTGKLATPTVRKTTTVAPTTTPPVPMTAEKQDGTYVAVGCYSNFYKPKVQISCEEGTLILINFVFFGTRDVAMCPESGLIEGGSEACCEPKCGDCVTYGGHGEVNNLLKECSYRQNCSVWTQRSVMPECGNKSFTSYMAVHYQCTQTGMDPAKPMSFQELYCPPGSFNVSEVTSGRPTLTTSITRPSTLPTATSPPLTKPTVERKTTLSGFSKSRPPTRSQQTAKTTRKLPGFGSPSSIPKAYPDNSQDEETESKKVLIGAVIGGVASVLVIGITFVVVLHLRRREKTVVTRRQSLDRKRKRKRNYSKNNSQCTNSTHLNSVAAPSNLTTINVIFNPGRLPGKGDYNHLERWLGDLETSPDNFDLPRISEVSESDTDADIESRVRKITTLQYHPPDILHESDS